MTVPKRAGRRVRGLDDLAAIWSPEHKIVLRRHLLDAGVLEAQRDLGVDVPDGVGGTRPDVVNKVRGPTWT